jgi:hypothetical protein
MATSGDYGFDPQIAEIVDDAFERSGVDPAQITSRHITSARRSLNFMMQSWMNQKIHLWNVDLQREYKPSQGDTSIELDDGVFEVVEATVVTPSGNNTFETLAQQISRDEYTAIPDKDIEGRPDRFWVEKQRDKSVMYFWPARDATGYYFRVNQWRRLETATAAAQNLDVPPEWTEAACADLAWRLAVKYNPQRIQTLKSLATEAVRDAVDSNAERAATVITVGFGSRGGRRYGR